MLIKLHSPQLEESLTIRFEHKAVHFQNPGYPSHALSVAFSWEFAFEVQYSALRLLWFEEERAVQLALGLVGLPWVKARSRGRTDRLDHAVKLPRVCEACHRVTHTTRGRVSLKTLRAFFLCLHILMTPLPTGYRVSTVWSWRFLNCLEFSKVLIISCKIDIW